MSLSETFVFEVISRKHGAFTVTVPVECKDAVLSRKWQVRFMRGKPIVQAHITTSGGHKSTLALHKLVWPVIGMGPAPQIDHVDRNPLNNSKGNLRAATWSQNQFNRGLSSVNRSGATGVSWNKGARKWRAYLTIEGKQVHLGLFASKDEAVRARTDEAKKMHGEFYCRDSAPGHRAEKEAGL